MQNNVVFVAGMQLRTYEVHRPSNGIDEKGRVSKGGLAKIGEVTGSIATVSEREVMRYKQIGHDVTHVIIAQGRAKVQAEDVLTLDGQRYHVHSVDDPALLGIYTVIACERKGE